MENHNDCYIDIVKEINKHKDNFSKRDYKKYRLDLLIRMAKRVVSFSADCNECQKFEREIKKRAEGLANLTQSSQEERKSYLNTIRNISNHLQKHHKLIAEGYYIGVGGGIGLVLGAAIGLALDNIVLGPGLGLVLGAAIGSAMDAKAKKEGKVI